MIPTIIGSTVSLTITVIVAVIKLSQWTGNINNRIESLENWRSNIRGDMHEISDKMDDLSKRITTIVTIVDERTARTYK